MESLTIKTVAEGSPMSEYELGPGVFGYAIEVDGAVYIPVMQATDPGSGQVGEFLDRVPSNVRIPNVVSSVLRGMLLRRGWRAATEIDESGEAVSVEVFVHPEADQ